MTNSKPLLVYQKLATGGACFIPSKFIYRLGETAFYPVLDTRASNSTGPVYETLGIPGTYQFRIYASINATPCNISPTKIEATTITIHVIENDDDDDNGEADCNSKVGEPVNVTNGNMYLSQTDYQLPGVGGINLALDSFPHR